MQPTSSIILTLCATLIVCTFRRENSSIDVVLGYLVVCQQSLLVGEPRSILTRLQYGFLLLYRNRTRTVPSLTGSSSNRFGVSPDADCTTSLSCALSVAAQLSCPHSRKASWSRRFFGIRQLSKSKLSSAGHLLIRGRNPKSCPILGNGRTEIACS